MEADSDARWARVLGYLTRSLPPGAVSVDGHQQVERFATRLLAALDAAGRHDVVIAPDAATVIWLRTPLTEGRPSQEHRARVVVDLHHPTWPVLRRIDLLPRDEWYLAETQAFFAVRARTWEIKYGDDLPAYAAAVTESALPPGGVVIDVGCGTGRGMPALRAAVGPAGTVIGFDVTPQMLATAHDLGRDAHGALVLADARHLPLRSSTVDGVFAAGLIGHVPEVDPVLTELARVTRPGGTLALFHPTGRATLAARRGRELRPDEPLNEGPLGAALDRTGWRLDRYDDTRTRFYARALRRS